MHPQPVLGRATRFLTIAAISLCLAATITGCGRSPVDAHAPLEAFGEHLESSVPRLMRAYDVPGVAIALVRGGEPVWFAAFGLADREQGRPLAIDAVFQTGSISKSVAAWGAMLLVEQGLVGLDDPLPAYLDDWAFPAMAFPANTITLRRVLSHTTGASLGPIGNEYPPDGAMPSLRDALARDLRVEREPGTVFGYSNPGFDLVELVIEEVSGRPFAQFMEDEVLQPLGMHDASYSWREAERARLPLGYDLHGTPVAPYVYATKASGGLFATVADIARFVAAGTGAANGPGQRVLTDAGVRALHAPETTIPGVFGVVADAYALGHFVETLPDGRRAVWHGGQGNGWMTHFHAVPETGDGIVILANSQRSWPLMARTLGDWAIWTGAGSVKFGVISNGIAAMWALIGVLVATTLWLALRLIRGVRGGRLRLAPLARTARFPRSLRAVLGVGTLALLAWRASQPYLIETSVFPGVAALAGWSIAALACVLVVSAALSPPERTTV